MVSLEIICTELWHGGLVHYRLELIVLFSLWEVSQNATATGQSSAKQLVTDGKMTAAEDCEPINTHENPNTKQVVSKLLSSAEEVTQGRV